jgi:citrate lyase subunit beta/citryl-CoA lyase
MGFDGKACIHPNQIGIIHDVFNPTKDEMVYAQKVIHAIEEAKAKGLGVVSIGTKMVDKPIQLKAEKVLARARAAELPIPKIEDILAEEAAKAAKKGKGGDGDG